MQLSAVTNAWISETIKPHSGVQKCTKGPLGPLVIFLIEIGKVIIISVLRPEQPTYMLFCKSMLLFAIQNRHCGWGTGLLDFTSASWPCLWIFYLPLPCLPQSYYSGFPLFQEHTRHDLASGPLHLLFCWLLCLYQSLADFMLICLLLFFPFHKTVSMRAGTLSIFLLLCPLVPRTVPKCRGPQ